MGTSVGMDFGRAFIQADFPICFVLLAALALTLATLLLFSLFALRH